MKKIDRETVNRILDAADIVDVVSDFVTLKRRGANYIGLCPFHSERTPSFSVSKSKGICKCFSCGKGGSPVNFLMELEQMSYQEALRWLAKKYGIEINEREETEEERREASVREALFAVNAFALGHFEHNLTETPDGREIGLAYFTERGLTPATIKKFNLGYALERSDTLLNDARKHGFTDENLVKTGLCARSDRGMYDRFRGRVIYPVHSMSGKIVAFGGRTLKSDKSVAKYVNSPESEIYSKSNELYGLYQARRAIVSQDKCILVEGYMDVLSMSQSGVENVVASSGTSLTTRQVNIIHRFTNNVTVIYDADAAGIKASLRGIDMLLSEDMNVKVVLFPPGEDPDSFAQSHTNTELVEYLSQNETDFIKFKTSVLLKDSGNDPVRRSHAIADVLRSIAVIPDPITRQVYIDESSRTFGIDAKMLSLEVAKGVAKIAEDAFVARRRAETAKTIEKAEEQPATTTTPAKIARNPLLRYEQQIARYLVRYGMLYLCETYDDQNNPVRMTVFEYVDYEMADDNITFSDPVIARLVSRLRDYANLWPQNMADLEQRLQAFRDEQTKAGLERIRQSATDLSQIQKAEDDLKINVDEKVVNYETELRRTYFERTFLSDPDDDIRLCVTDLASERYHLSKVHSKFAHVETEEERLNELVPRAIYELKDAILGLQIANIRTQITQAANDPDATNRLLSQLMEKTALRADFARYLGERIVTPPIVKQ